LVINPIIRTRIHLISGVNHHTRYNIMKTNNATDTNKRGKNKPKQYLVNCSLTIKCSSHIFIFFLIWLVSNATLWELSHLFLTSSGWYICNPFSIWTPLRRVMLSSMHQLCYAISRFNYYFLWNYVYFKQKLQNNIVNHRFILNKIMSMMISQKIKTLIKA
jgi:hypothetical protein